MGKVFWMAVHFAWAYLERAFPGVQALKDVDCDLRPGEVHTLLKWCWKKHNGRILTGVYIKDGGTIWLNGKKVDFQSPIDAMQMGISVIHQELASRHGISWRETLPGSLPVQVGDLELNP